MTIRSVDLLGEEEPLGVDGLPSIVFEERALGLDDEEASELASDVVIESPPALVSLDDIDGPDGAVIDEIEDVTRAGSWVQAQPDDVSVLPDVVLDALPESSASDDVEGPDDSAIVLGAPPPLDRSDDDADGPAGLVDPDAVALGGAPYAFALAAPAACSFVALSDRDADQLVRDRADQLRTDDGDARATDRAPRIDSSIAVVRAGETLAFAFARGAGKVSFDGGETFADARWLERALALAAIDGAVFAAVYDSAVDRCTIVRATPFDVRRVADVHALLAGVVDDDAGFAVRALVALDASGERLLVRTNSVAVALSVPSG
jgi:hypothetical protein